MFDPEVTDVTDVGALGAEMGVIGLEASDGAPMPSTLTAETVKV